MGHQIDFTRFDINSDKKKIQAQLDDYAAHEDYFEGCTGLPNQIRWIDIVAKNYDEAKKYIEYHDNGCYDQLAVKYLEYPQFTPSKKYSALEEKVNEAYAKYNSLSSSLFFKDHKSSFLTCKSCSSKLSIKHLRSNYCPVCGKSMIPDTRQKQIEAAKAKYEELKERLYTEKLHLQEKQKKHSKMMWLVKTEFHV